MSPSVQIRSRLSAACEASLLREFSTQTQLQPEEAEDRDWLCFYRAGQGFDGGGSCGRVAVRPALTCAMVSGSRGLPLWWRWPSVKPVYWPEEVERRIGGLSNFFSDSWRLMLVKLPWPVRRRRSGLSIGMWLWLRSMSRGLKWPRTGEPISGVPPCPPWPWWEGCTMQWTSVGRAGGRRDGGSDLFLCLLRNDGRVVGKTQKRKSIYGTVVLIFWHFTTYLSTKLCSVS